MFALGGLGDALALYLAWDRGVPTYQADRLGGGGKCGSMWDGSGCISMWGGGVLASPGDCLSVVYTVLSVCCISMWDPSISADLLWLPTHPKLYICYMYLNKHWIIPGDTALCHIDSRARCFATDNHEPEPEPEPNFGHSRWLLETAHNNRLFICIIDSA